MTIDTTLLFALALSLFANLYMISRDQKLRNVLQGALDKADLDRVEFAKVHVNQLQSLGFRSRHGVYRSAKEFKKSTQTKHPALLSPHRRGKL